MNFKYVYKICTETEWTEAKTKGKFIGSKKDLMDGFIHFSDKSQIKGTLNKFFSKEMNLILLKIDTLKLESLVWEQASDGDMFPHLYSHLDISNVCGEYYIALDKNGSYILPLDF